MTESATTIYKPNNEVIEQQKNLLRQSLIRTQSVLSPPKAVPLSEWAEENLRITGALAGKYKTANAPFQKEVLDAINDPNNDRIVIMGASQMLKTIVLLAYIGYIIDRDPGPAMIIQPTKSMADVFAKERIDPLIYDTPALRDKFLSTSRRDGNNTLRHKQFPGGTLDIAVAGSVSELASRAIKFLLLDEVDRYENTREGDPIALAEKRITTFWDSNVVMVSSPGDENTSKIAKEYEESDKRIYECQCPHCNHHAEMKWEHVKWNNDKELSIHEKAATANYVCEACGSIWSEGDRLQAIKNGRWTATRVSPVVGFRISALASTFIKLSTLVVEHYQAQGDIEKRRAFVNTRLAETFKDQTSSVQPHKLFSRVEEYDPQNIPSGVALLTAGVDVQADRLEMEIVGWGAGDENWSIDYHVLQGDPNSAAPWDQLKTILEDTYKREDGVLLKIQATCIDTGFSAQSVFDFTFNNKRLNIYPIKGFAGHNRMIFKKQSRNMKGKRNGRYYQVGVDTAKERHYFMLNVEEPGAGYAHFPTGYEDDYFEGLVSEERVERYQRGRKVIQWRLKKQSVRNEALDCRVYAMAARMSYSVDLGAHNKKLTDRHAAKQETELKSDVEDEKPQPPKISPARRPFKPTSSWVKGRR